MEELKTTNSVFHALKLSKTTLKQLAVLTAIIILFLRQGNLALEMVWKTQSWGQRVTATLFGMFQTDAYLAFCSHTGNDLSFREFNREVISKLFSSAHSVPATSTHRVPCTPQKISEVLNDPKRFQQRCSSSVCERGRDGRSRRTRFLCRGCLPVIVPLCTSKGVCFLHHVTDQLQSTSSKRTSVGVSLSKLSVLILIRRFDTKLISCISLSVKRQNTTLK